MSWDLDLVLASFGGVEFQTQRITDSQKRRWVEHKYPGVNGADMEDLGAEPRGTSLTAVFAGPDYLFGLSDLMQEVAKGEIATFQHPLFGTWQARCQIESIEHADNARDTCTVDLTFVEDGAGADVEVLESTYVIISQLENGVTAAQSALDAVTDALEAFGSAVDDVQDAIDSVEDFIDDATESATKAINSMNSTIRKLERAVVQARRLGDLDSYALVNELRQTNRRTQKLGKRVLGDKWPLRSQVVPANTTATQIAHELYGDGTRSGELADLNPATVRNPFFIAAGTVLKVFNS